MGRATTMQRVGSLGCWNRDARGRSEVARVARLLGVAVAIAGLAGTASAAITPVDAWATSWFSTSGVQPIHMIDGSGLSGAGSVETQVHATGPTSGAGVLWHAGESDGGLGGPTGNPPAVSSQAVVFDLGGLAALSGAWIWNENQPSPYTSRGVDQFEILVSSDSNPFTATFTSLGTFSLSQACGCNTEPAQFVGFSALNVRLVRFEFISTHTGSPTDYVGLSEVRFKGSIGVSDDFEDGDDAGWTHNDASGTGSWSFPAGAYRLQASPTNTPANPARAGSYRPDTEFLTSDFFVSVDVVDFDPAKQQVFGLLVRQREIGPGTLDGYALSWSTATGLTLSRVDNEVPTTLAAEPIALHPSHRYRLALRVEGSDLRGGLYDLALPRFARPVAVVEATDATYASTGPAGLFVYDNSAGGTSGADATFDLFSDHPAVAIQYSGPNQDLVGTANSGDVIASLLGDGGGWDDLGFYCEYLDYGLGEYEEDCSTILQSQGNSARFVASGGNVARLSAGAAIGPSAIWLGDGYKIFMDHYVSPPIDATSGEWGNQTGYAGIRLTNGPSTYYGWGRFTGSGYGTLTFHEWAFATTPGVPILAGQTSSAQTLPDILNAVAVPALPPGALPALAGLLAALGAGWLRLGRRR